MRLVNVETLQLEEFVEHIPTYAILSHTWGKDEEEVSFSDIQSGNIEKAGAPPMKFEGCCRQAKKDDCRYAWIDTCCIDKTDSVELGEAINSMFQWYRNASICYVYLSDVPHGDKFRDPGSKFFSSRWFTRGWTLQELLAPKQLRFYDQTWSFLGAKREMASVVEKITSISRLFLLGSLRLHEASVSQRMSWAANRATKRKEDIAYCLLGIFSVMMPMIYGEGEQAFRRLQEEIMKKTRDDSILAWAFNRGELTPTNSTDAASGGIFATSPSDFANCGQIAPWEQHVAPTNALEISGGYLRAHLPLHTTPAGDIFGLLNCGLERHAEQVVGIPLRTTVSGEQSEAYVRPQGHSSVLLPKATSSNSITPVYIQIERAHAERNRRHWFYIEESVETGLELRDVFPPSRWQKDRAMIMTANDSDRDILQQSFARFRAEDEDSRDVVVVLEFEVQKSEVKAQYHVMIASRDTPLEDLSQKLHFMGQEAFREQTASNGRLHVNVAVTQERIAGQQMFVVRLAAMPSPPKTTVDATLELQKVTLKLKFVRNLDEEDKIRPQAEQLTQQRDEKSAAIDQTQKRLAEVEESLRKLNNDKRVLIKRLEQEALEMDHAQSKGKEIWLEQNRLSEERLEVQKFLNDIPNGSFNPEEAPGNWFETIMKKLLNAGTIDVELKDIGDIDSDPTYLPWAAESGNNTCTQTPLLWAATNGREAIVEKLLEDGVNLEPEDENGQTPLCLSAEKGHQGVVVLLLRKGANREFKEEKYGQTPLSLAAKRGHTAVVNLLLKKDADREAEDNDSRTPLSLAAENGHEAVVKLLRESGAELEPKTKHGRTPLSLAADVGHKAVVEMLLKKGADREAKDKKYGMTPLSWAAFKGQEVVAKLLIDAKALVDSKDESGQTPLSWAAQNGHEAVVRLLLDSGAEVELKDEKHGRTPLWWAVYGEHWAVVKLLLGSSDVDVDSKDNEHEMTMLSWAVKNGHEPVVKALLDTGKVDVNSESGNKSLTPLLWAAERGHEAIARLLVGTGMADMRARDTGVGLTPLAWAAFRGHAAVVKLLLGTGNGDVDAKDTYNRTPLSRAAENGYADVVKLLLDTGKVDVDAKDVNGRTALSRAAEKGHEAVVRLLVGTGKVDVDLKDVYGQTPRSWAEENEHYGVGHLLMPLSSHSTASLPPTVRA